MAISGVLTTTYMFLSFDSYFPIEGSIKVGGGGGGGGGGGEAFTPNSLALTSNSNCTYLKLVYI